MVVSLKLNPVKFDISYDAKIDVDKLKPTITRESNVRM